MSCRSALVAFIVVSIHARAQAPVDPSQPLPTAPIVPATTIVPAAAIKAPTDDLLTMATKACTAAMTDAKANALVSPAPFIQFCIDDVKLTGKLDFIDGHKKNYLAKVEAEKARETATKWCTSAIFNAASEKILPSAPYIRACIAEAGQPPNAGMVAHHQKEYQAKIKSMTPPKK